MKMKQLLFCILCVIVLCIIYNLYKTSNTNYSIENFESILKGLNNNNSNKKKKKNNNNSDNNDNKDKKNIFNFKKSFNKLKSEKTGTTFDDLFKATENMDTSKLSFSNMTEELSKYYDSFDKTKFKNNSKSSAESFDKFKLYKEQFFNIFK